MTGERYRVNPLPHPDGAEATPGLIDLIDWSGTAIEKSLKLLGSGDTTRPSEQLEGDGKVVDIDEKTHSVSVKNYSDLAKTVTDATKKIQDTDGGVDTSTFSTSTIAGGAFANIKGYVDTLKSELGKIPAPIQDKPTEKNPNPPKRLSAQAVDMVLAAVGKAVGSTEDRVAKAQTDIQQQADNIANNAPPAYAGNSGGGVPFVPVSYSGGSGGGGGGGVNYTGGTTTQGGQTTLSGSRQEKARLFMERLIKVHHFTPAQAAGIVANIEAESGFNPNGPRGDGGTAFGICQWRFDRQANLREFCGSDINSWEKQLDFMVHELRNDNGFNKAEAAINSNKNDPAAVAAAFDRLYEKSSGSTTSRRETNARGLLADANAIHAAQNIAV